MMRGVVSSLVKSRAALQLESVALRHQIGVLQRSAKKRLPLNNSDHLLWIGHSQERVATYVIQPSLVSCAASHGPDIYFATLVVRWDLLVQLVRKVLYGRDVTQLRNLAVRFRLFDAESATD
jgi:hypothetical protein